MKAAVPTSNRSARPISVAAPCPATTAKAHANVSIAGSNAAPSAQPTTFNTALLVSWRSVAGTSFHDDRTTNWPRDSLTDGASAVIPAGAGDHQPQPPPTA